MYLFFERTKERERERGGGRGKGGAVEKKRNIATSKFTVHISIIKYNRK